MMVERRNMLLALLLLAGPALQAPAQMYARLVSEQKPKSVIMIGENATTGEIFAAELLRDCIQKMTDARIPIWRDDSLDPLHRDVVVSVGRTRWLAPSVRKEMRFDEALPPDDAMSDAFLVEKAQRHMLLAGRDDLGTARAVCAFLTRVGFVFTPEGEAAVTNAKVTYVPVDRVLRELKRPDAEFRKRFAWLTAALAKAADVKRPVPRTAACPYLVRDGRPAAAVVVGAHALEKELIAAERLREYVRRMSGVELPLFRDDGPPPPAGQLVVSVGRTSYLPADLRKELRIGGNVTSYDAIHDAIAVVKTPGVLHLAGHRDHATIFAVYEFLEGLGCRWYFGNEVGVVVPAGLRDIEVKESRVIRMPDFPTRYIFAWWGGFRDEEDNSAEAEWHLTNRLSEGEARGYSGHNFDQILPAAMYQTHPEYFSMVKGRRLNPAKGENWQMCLTNPGVIKLAAQWAEMRLALEPGNELVTFAPNDGYGQCECPECRKVGNNSDVNLYFAREVGKLIFPEHPHVLICVWAYALNAVVPQKLKADGYDEGRDRVFVAISENSKVTPWRELISGYGKAAHRLGIHKDWHIIGYDAGGMRPVNHRDTFEEFPFYKDCHIVSIGLQAVSHWASNGLDRYIVAKLMWNARADVDALIAEFCRTMFPSCPDDFAAFLRLQEAKGKYERRPYGDYHPENLPERPGEITWQQWVAGGLDILERMRGKIRTVEEKKRWQFYALYMHEQVLEFTIETTPSDSEKVRLFMQMVSFLKGTRDVRFVDANMVIGKGFGGAMRGAGYPGRDLDFSEIPPLPVTEQLITVLYEKDREKFPAAGAPKAQ